MTSGLRARTSSRRGLHGLALHIGEHVRSARRPPACRGGIRRRRWHRCRAERQRLPAKYEQHARPGRRFSTRARISAIAASTSDGGGRFLRFRPMRAPSWRMVSVTSASPAWLYTNIGTDARSSCSRKSVCVPYVTTRSGRSESIFSRSGSSSAPTRGSVPTSADSVEAANRHDLRARRRWRTASR